MARSPANIAKKSSVPASPPDVVPDTVPDAAAAVEAVFGCKWSLRILRLIRAGVCRPGAIERSLHGLTTKVQHHYLQRMLSLGVLERTVFPEIPPRVEYRLTPFAQRLLPILESIDQLQSDLDSAAISTTDTASADF